MDKKEIAAALEAVLFASGDPVPAERVAKLLGVTEKEVLAAADSLAAEYTDRGSGIRLLHLADKLQLCSAAENAESVIKAMETRKPPVLSPSALETLSIVAYYQPVTTAYVNRLRGVDSSYSIGSLCDRGLIAPTGHLEAPGRPLLYSTTDLFLRTMQISNLNELPPLPDMKQNGAIEKLMNEIEYLKPSGGDSLPIPGQTVIGESD